MEFTVSFINTARKIFLDNEGNTSTLLDRTLSLENNNLFNRFLVTDVTGDEIEIPVIARRHIEDTISGAFQSISGTIGFKTIVLPLYENSVPYNRRTFYSFIRQFFSNVTFDNRLQKIISSKGEVYYGGKGIIFDSAYNPLILCTLRAKKVKQSTGLFKLLYYKPVIYVSPIVFTEPNKLINKGIIKQIIPFYTDRGIIFPNPGSIDFLADTTDIEKDSKAAVIIDNMDRFFVKPTVPKPQSCTMEALNECLVDNIEDILRLV